MTHIRPATRALFVSLALLGCDASTPDAPPSPTERVTPPAPAAAKTPHLESQTPAAPAPVEPAPSKPELADEAPELVAELEADPNYQGIWTPDRRADLDVLLLGVSAALAQGPVGSEVMEEIKARDLSRCISRVLAVRERTGKLPESFAEQVREHVARVAEEPNRGLWSEARTGPPRDHVALAVYTQPNDPQLLRELLAARAGGSPIKWASTKEPPKRPWLATERGVLERLALVDTLTEAERERLHAFSVRAHKPDEQHADTLPLGPTAKRKLATVSKRFGVSVATVSDKVAKAVELCMTPTNIGSAPKRAAALAGEAVMFVEGVSKTAAEREAMPLDEAFVAFVLAKCPSR